MSSFASPYSGAEFLPGHLPGIVSRYIPLFINGPVNILTTKSKESARDALSLVAAVIVTEPSEQNQEYWNFEWRIMNHVQHLTKYYEGIKNPPGVGISEALYTLGKANFYWGHYKRCANLYRMEAKSQLRVPRLCKCSTAER